jgi:sterol 3beta-glucosyltransferase
VNGLDIAEKLNVPAMVAFYLPALTPTRAFPAPFIPGPASWGGVGNRISHGLFLRLLTAPYHRLTNRWRSQTLGLPPRPFWSEDQQRYGKSIPKLYGYSRHLVPTPPDWDTSAHVTGQWFLNDSEKWQPSRELVEFIGAGAPPVFVSFGSISGRDPVGTTRLVLWRGGGGGICDTGVADQVCFIDAAPYHKLFPKMAAVVHHGGAGSTGEGLRAGRPTVVCPFFGDQPYWGRRVFELGVGPKPIPQKRLTASALARSIHTAVSDSGMIDRASVLGEKIRAEDGVRTAVEVIHELLGLPAVAGE